MLYNVAEEVTPATLIYGFIIIDFSFSLLTLF